MGEATRAVQSSTFLNQPSRDTSVVIDNQTISCPSRRATLLALSFVDLKDIGSFLSDTYKMLTLVIRSLSKVDGRDDQHPSLRECKGG